MMCLAAVVVFCTTYALVLPAVTMEKETYCGIEDHVHVEACYENQLLRVDEGKENVDGDAYDTMEAVLESDTTDAGEAVLESDTTDAGEETTENDTTDAGEETTESSATDAGEETTESSASDAGEETTESDTTDAGEETTESSASDAGDETAGGSAANTTEMTVPRADAEETGDAAPTVTKPLEVEKYVTQAKVSYKKDDMADWKDVKGETDVPGDASFKLEIEYENVPIDDLEQAGYQMTYNLPDLFRDAVASGDIVSGNEKVGTIVTEQEKIILSLDKNWVEKQKPPKQENSGNGQADSESNQTINGKFYVTAKVNLSAVPGDGGSTEIYVGKVKITIDFKDDLYANSVDIALEKEVGQKLEETDEGIFLAYTITVKTGIDSVPNVVVKDIFDNNEASKYIESYVFSKDDEENVTIERESDTAPCKLTWNIGMMKANETRTLTYKVKLKEEYKLFCLKQNVNEETKRLVNTADVYVNDIQRDDASAAFVPKYTGNVWKYKSSFVPDGNGGGTITYTVLLEAPESNNIALEDVIVKDALDGSLEAAYKTDEKYREHIYYDESSFKLWDGGHKNSGGTDGLEQSDKQGILVFPQEEKHNSHFQYTIGRMEPGEMKTLSYKIVIEPGVYAAAGNSDVKITNRAFMYAGSNADSDGKKLNQSTTTATISKKMWSRKLAGAKEENAKTVLMDLGEQYKYSEEGTEAATLVKQESREANFVVPAGSYQYQVVANEAGDWDVSSAVMKDAFQNEYMAYVGYVRVDAYKISNAGNQGNAGSGNSVKTDEETIKGLKERTADKTAWIYVDGKKSFEFKPGDIGMNEANAYLLTYYAFPGNLGDVTTVVVANDFNISGNVGIWGKEYVLTGVSVSASVNAEGSNYFAVNKQFWYYDTSLRLEGATAEGYKNGALYWIIRVDGNMIPAGTEIKDKPTPDHGVHDTQLYGEGELQFFGVYRGSSDTDFTDKTIASLEGLGLQRQSLKVYAHDEKQYDTEVAKEDFQCWNQGFQIPFKFNKDVVLNENESLYFIISTSPNELPQKGRDSKTFENTVQSKDKSSSDWVTHNTASYTIHGNDGIFKEVGQVFTYDKSSGTITNLKGGDNGNAGIKQDEIPSSGTYVAWQIQLNHFGNLSGRYRVLEQIPEGMELVCVRHYWSGSKVSNLVMIPKIQDFEESWEKHTNGTCTFYTKDREAVWEIDGLVNGGEKDSYAVEFQVLCRVTDSDVLQGGIEKSFDNKVILLAADGTKMDDHRSAVTLKRETLEKSGVYDPEVNSGCYPFKITLNDLGEDLVKGANQITLIDEMCEILTIDTTSINVINTKTGEVVSDWKSSIEGNILKITLPDNLPLTITYEARVNAAPGQKVDISNKAYWEGYASSGGSSVQVKDFSYGVGGSVETKDTPTVKVIKLDQNNNQKYLSNAEFTLTKVEWKDDAFVPANSDSVIKWIGSTEENGIIVFGTGSEKGVLEYNTVYCLQETRAPEGYRLDSTPHYFAVAKKVKAEGEGEGKYPEQLNEWAAEGVKIQYEGYQYVYQAYNRRGEISVTKRFQNADGNLLERVDGIYTFGIYDQEITEDILNAEGEIPKAMHTAAIKFANNAVEPESGIVTFKDLELDKTYYVYELDSNGRPIIGSDVVASIGGKPFRVSYEKGSKVTIDAQGNVAVGDEDVQPESGSMVIVINRINYPELPQTGGSGSMPFKMGGILLLLTAFLVFIRKLHIS